jgi:predicted house-cleaning noncanonical NTP pyrophosphatase (MazG superfamily)
MTRVLRFRVEKLIRDGLPDIMRAQGLAVFDRRLDGGALRKALADKLVEEAREAQEAESTDELLGELADVCEVIAALAAAHGITADAIETARLRKRAERGGFDDGVFNAAVAAPEGSAALDYYLARPEQYPPQEPVP